MSIDLKMTAEHFLKSYWQKKPHKFLNALKRFKSPIDRNDLAALAMRPDSLARLVSGSGTGFSVKQGPFAEADYASLKKKNWTLLVQDVDKFDPDVRALLQHFDFLPRWRIEDVMVSYAVTGGSVGAHVDQYDVFLLQAAGKRRWQIDSRKQPDLTPLLGKSQLRLLKNFQPDKDWVLTPGDMLYLPPGVPHHGVALDDDCMTFSIGLRAPSSAELLSSLAHQMAELDQQRLADPDLAPATDPSTIDALQLARVRQALGAAINLSDADFADWFGKMITGYRSPWLPELPKLTNPADEVNKLSIALQRGKVLLLDSRMRVAKRFDGKAVYMGHKKFILSNDLQQQLCSFDASVDSACFLRLSATERALLAQLKKLGVMRLAAVHAS